MTIESIQKYIDIWAEKHPEQLFIAKSVILMLLVIAGQDLLSDIIFISLFSLGFICYLILDAVYGERGVRRTFFDNLGIWWLPHADKTDHRKEIPWCTFVLLLVNIICHIAIADYDPDGEITGNLIWLPYEPDIINIPASLFSSLFIHANNDHLIGNMFFLWVFGSAIERRIGQLRFVICYMSAGVISNLLSLLVYGVIMGEELHSVGASGAIAGLMGLYLVRCYYKQMIFPVPILGILPINIKIKVNAFVIIGLYFALDLHEGFVQLAGESDKLTSHWAHIGGLVTGIIIAYGQGMHHEAVEERHLELGTGIMEGSRSVLTSGVDAAGGFAGAEKSLQTVISKNPENHQAWLQLARMKSLYYATDEGWQLYSKTIGLMLKTAHPDLPAIYRECYGVYQRPLDNEQEYRCAAILYKHGDLDMASRALENLLASNLPVSELRERALFQLARILEEMGLQEAALQRWQSFVKTFPGSMFCDNAQIRIARLEQQTRPVGSKPEQTVSEQEEYKYR